MALQCPFCTQIVHAGAPHLKECLKKAAVAYESLTERRVPPPIVPLYYRVPPSIGSTPRLRIVTEQLRREESGAVGSSLSLEGNLSNSSLLSSDSVSASSSTSSLVSQSSSSSSIAMHGSSSSPALDHADSSGSITRTVSPQEAYKHSHGTPQSSSNPTLRFTLETIKPKPSRAATFRRRPTKPDSDLPPFILGYISTPMSEEEVQALLEGTHPPTIASKSLYVRWLHDTDNLTAYM